MTIPVSLKEVAGAVEAVPEEWHPFTNRQTGEVHMLPGEFSLIGEQEEDQELWQQIESSDDFVKLPNQWDRDDYRVMQRFPRAIPTTASPMPCSMPSPARARSGASRTRSTGSASSRTGSPSGSSSTRSTWHSS